jgi:NAD(P)-dependent dehydrogenase (short-subunit alcohol dehydrogenase family)
MKQVILFGGSGGIGFALLRAVLDRFSRVVVTLPLRSGVALPGLNLGPTQVVNNGVWTDEDSLEKIVKNHREGFDLCLSAIGGLHTQGMMPEKKISQLNESQFMWAFQSNVIPNAIILKHVMPQMKANAVMGFLSARVGSISDNALGGWYSYRSSKAALNMLIKTAAIEAKRTNPTLSIIGIHPGTVDTALSAPFQANVPNKKLFSPMQSANYIFDHILNRIGPQDSGHIVAWDGTIVPW